MWLTSLPGIGGRLLARVKGGIEGAIGGFLCMTSSVAMHRPPLLDVVTVDIGGKTRDACLPDGGSSGKSEHLWEKLTKSEQIICFFC